MKRITLALIALLLLGGLSGCLSGSPTPLTEAEPIETDQGSVERTIDSEADVVCYTYTVRDAGSIECMPINSTALR